MPLFAFHDLALEVRHEGREVGEGLARILHDLSWVETPAVAGKPALGLSVRSNGDGLSPPPAANEVLRAEGFRGLEAGDDFYLTDGASLLRLQAARGQADARLAPGFFDKPPFFQSRFWAFGLLKLLRPLGLYILHAAGVVAPDGTALLIVGESGCGKSTSTLGLIRQGWRYLSDDAVLLRLRQRGVEALALRKRLCVDAEAAPRFADLPLGEEVSVGSGRRKRRVLIGEAAPGRRVSGCRPRVLLFPRIAERSRSALRPLDRLEGLERLLAQSGPQLFDRPTMARQLECLKTLLQQTASYELAAGRDLHRRPEKLADLLSDVRGEGRWRASSSS